MPTGGIDILTAVGIDAATAASISTAVGSIAGDAGIGALTGAGVGGVEGIVTGQNPFKDAAEGAIGGAFTGGGVGIGGDLIGGAAGDVLGGAGGGALGSFIQGNNPLTGAAEGAVSGGIASQLAPSGGATSSNAGAPGGGSAGAASAPASIGPSNPDVTLDANTVNNQFAQGLGGNPSSQLNTSGLDNLAAQDPGSIPSATPSNPSISPTLGVDSSTLGSSSGLDSFVGANSATPSAPVSSNPVGTGGLPSSAPLANSVVANESAALPWQQNDLMNEVAANGGNTADPYGAQTSQATNNFVNNLGSGGGTGGSGGSGGASGPSTGSTFLKGLGGPVGQSASNFTSMLEANPGAALSGLGFGADLLKEQFGPGQKGSRELENQAAQLNTQGASLESYINSGTLPPGLQAGINQSADAAKAAIRSRYASMGSSGSSAEQQDLSAVDTQAQATAGNYALQLLKQGVDETGLSSKLYQEMLNGAVSGDNELGSAFGQFAAAMSGQPQVKNIQIPLG